MPGPGGESLGRAHIRILPDTSGFTQKLRAIVEWAERQTLELTLDLDAKQAEAKIERLTRDRRLDVDVDADTTRANAAVRKLERQRANVTAIVNAKINDLDVQARLLALSNRKVDVEVEPKLDEGMLAARLEALSRNRDFELKPDLNLASVEAQLKTLEEDAVHLKAEVDTAAARAELQSMTARQRVVRMTANLDTADANARINALVRRHRVMDVQVDLDTAIANLKMRLLSRDRMASIRANIDGAAKAEAILKFLARDRTVNIKANPRNNALNASLRAFEAGTRLVSTSLRGMVSVAGVGFKAVGSSIGGAAGLMGKLSEGTAEAGSTIGRMVSRVSGQMAEMGSRVGESATQFGSMAAQAGGSAPMALAKMGGSLASVSVAAGAMAAMVGGLVLVLGSLVHALVAVGGALIGIVGLLGAAATAMAAAAVGAVALAAVPLAPIAAGLGLAVLQGDRFKKKLEELKGAVTKFVVPAAKSMFTAFDGAFKDIQSWLERNQDMFRRFFEAGSKFVQPMVQSLTDFADNLIPRVTQALDSPGMKAGIEGMKQGFSGLGTAFGNTAIELSQHGQRFGAVFKQISMDLNQLLPALARFMGQVSVAPAQLSKFTAGITGFFEKLGASMERALDSRGFEEFMSSIQRGLTDLGGAIGRWVEEAARHGADFGLAFESIIGFLDRTAEPIARIMAAGARQMPELMDSLAGAIEKLEGPLTRFMDAFTPVTATVIDELARVLGVLFDKLSEPAITSALQELATQFGDLLVSIIGSGLLESLLDLANSFMELANAVTPTLVSTLTMVADGLSKVNGALTLGSQLLTGDYTSAFGTIGGLWDSLKDKITGGTSEVAQQQTTVFSDLRSNVYDTLSGIQQQSLVAARQVAADHGQMSGDVLSSWSNIQQYTNQVNSGIGTASEASAARVAVAAAEADAAWTSHMQTMRDNTKTVFDSISSSGEVTRSQLELQAEQMAQKATESGNKAGKGVGDGLKKGETAAKGAYDGMSSSSKKTWDKIVNDAKTGSSNMNVTSVQAWNDLAKKIESTLTAATSRINSHSKDATKQLGAVPKDAGGKWPQYATKVQSAMSKAVSAVRNACSQMKSALNQVTSGTYTINVKVNTTKTVTEIKKAASAAKASAQAMARAPQMPPPGLYAAPPMFAAEDVYETGTFLSRAAGKRDDREVQKVERPVNNYSAIVNANTNADPNEIGREVTWQFRRMTR
ncbi:hypothetical protein ABZV77_11590 [Streptomyces sp. NPDC004732]|uniref:hypothetical protein n=1 Tax=Streptomyces sp. NPDC004732 TaxID=3154290 RepID=UPI0033A8A372